MNENQANENRLQRFIDGQIAARPIEATLVRKIYKALKEAGTPIVRLYDGETWEKVESEKDLLDLAFDLDEWRAYTANESWVFVVMGQGAEGLTDWTIDLDPAFDAYGLTEWIDKNLD